MSLRETLCKLADKLESEDGFVDGSDPFDQAGPHRTPTELSKLCVGNTYPLWAFYQWVERCPEARDFLEAAGFHWDGGPALPAQPQPESGGVRRIVVTRDHDGTVGIPDLDGPKLMPVGYTYTKAEEFRAMVDGQYRPAFVTMLAAGVVQVTSVDDKVRRAAVTEREVHPADVQKFRSAVERFRAAANKAGVTGPPPPQCPAARPGLSSRWKKTS